MSAGFVTEEVGLTVILNIWGIPSQLLAFGVTVTFAEIGAFVEFFAVKMLIFPFPEAPIPIAVLSLVQLYVVPETLLPVKFIRGIDS